MLKEGDKLFHCWNGKLETVTYLSSVTTGHYTYYVVIENGKRNNVDPRWYFATKKEAYQQYLKECENAVESLIKHRKEVEENLKFCREEIIRINELIEYVV
jgi:hypothetical protein